MILNHSSPRSARRALRPLIVVAAMAGVLWACLPTSPHSRPAQSETPLSTNVVEVARTPHSDVSSRAENLAPSDVGLQDIVLCQCACSNGSPMRRGVECLDGTCRGNGREARWRDARMIPFQEFAQGEYCGLARAGHVSEYRLRPDDQLDFIFRLSRTENSKPYELTVGDEIRIQSFTDEKLNGDLIVQPDGTITLKLLGQIRATHHTVAQLRDEVEKAYEKYYKVPSITITPLKVNTKLEDLRATVDARSGQGGQHIAARVTPEGTVSLPALVSVPVQGLTLRELKRELDERYAHEVEGIEITPVLVQRAPRYVFVLGEVTTSGRFSLEGPTTVMQAIAMAGSFRIGANLNQVVVFRRNADWRMTATLLDLHGALHGHRPCPADEIWLNDSDIIVVPKSIIQKADEIVEMVFTRGIYGIIPAQNASSAVSRMSSF